jgi:two-component system sensor histidine kinase and response regulator WspE
MSPDLSKFSLWDLYRGEVEAHSKTLNEGLLALEARPDDLDRIKGLMRAAHSIKGAARVVQHALAVRVAHAMEDRLVAAQSGARPLGPDDIQRLLEGVDLLGRLSPVAEADRDAVVSAASPDSESLIGALSAVAPDAPAAAGPSPAPPSTAAATSTPVASAVPASTLPKAASASPEQPGPAAADLLASPGPAPVPPQDAGDRSVRLTAQTVTRMVGLAGEAVVATRWLEPFTNDLGRTKRRLAELATSLDRLELTLEDVGLPPGAASAVNDVQARLERARSELAGRLNALEQYSLRQDALSDRLYREVLATRMRPFGELVEGYPRLVRDLARQLGKKVKLEIEGASTDVDRDVAALLDAPLNHVVRNAVDHGLEPPEERRRLGKPEAGTLLMRAFHRAGMLHVEVVDDGRGVDVERLRTLIVERGLSDAAMAARLGEPELLEFLFLPGFSTASRVTDVSGRGVGLDVVLETMKKVGGRARIVNRPGRGLTARFEMPVSLSVLRALVVEVAGEPYAMPLTRLDRVVTVARAEVQDVEGRQFISVGVLPGTSAPSGGVPPEREGSEGELVTRHVGLATARQVLGIAEPAPPAGHVSVVVVRERDDLYGMVVDRLIGEEDLVVRPLDPRLGKVPDVAAAAIAFDGSPLLVLDVDDMIRSLEQIVSTGRLIRVGEGGAPEEARRKRVLVVDDSITVREVERQALEAHGYAVDVAVDGIDGWNAVRTGRYDLVVTDVDMPRLDGIELVKRLRADARYASLPIVIVSYKDREEDRLRGLDAGASYYLPKSAFQDDTFLRAVDDLIGAPEA